MEEKVLDIINRYIKIELGDDTNEIGYYKYIFELTIVPTFLQLCDISTGFVIIIHSNKKLIKIKENYGFNVVKYKLDYDFTNLLYEIYLLDCSTTFYYPSTLRKDIEVDLNIHHRNRTIDNILL